MSNISILKLSEQSTFLDNTNSRFSKTDGGFVELRTNINDEDKVYNRVNLVRAFPFKTPNEYVIVNDNEAKEDAEVGIIINLDTFTGDERKILDEELDRRYFVPEIVKIISVKEKFGFSNWKVTTSKGEVMFAVSDIYRSLIKLGDGRYFILDVEGNRYEIPNIEKLDLFSVRQIEMYL